MDNLVTSLGTTMDKAPSNTSGDILERLIKPRASTIFVNLVYSIDGTEPPIAVSLPYEEFSTVILLYGWVEIIFIWMM